METQLERNTKRINLGTGNPKFSLDANRKVNYVLATLFFIMAAFYVFKGTVELFERIAMSSLYFITSGLFFFRAYIELSTSSKYAAHFIISDNGLTIKTGVLKKSQFIEWDTMKEIEFGSYQIGIKDHTGIQYFSYQTDRETSIEIKQAIHAIASKKGIV